MLLWLFVLLSLAFLKIYSCTVFMLMVFMLVALHTHWSGGEVGLKKKPNMLNSPWSYSDIDFTYCDYLITAIAISSYESTVYYPRQLSSHYLFIKGNSCFWKLSCFPD